MGGHWEERGGRLLVAPGSCPPPYPAGSTRPTAPTPVGAATPTWNVREPPPLNVLISPKTPTCSSPPPPPHPIPTLSAVPAVHPPSRAPCWRKEGDLVVRGTPVGTEGAPGGVGWGGWGSLCASPPSNPPLSPRCHQQSPAVAGGEGAPRAAHGEGGTWGGGGGGMRDGDRECGVGVWVGGGVWGGHGMEGGQCCGAQTHTPLLAALMHRTRRTTTTTLTCRCPCPPPPPPIPTSPTPTPPHPSLPPQTDPL